MRIALLTLAIGLLSDHGAAAEPPQLKIVVMPLTASRVDSAAVEVLDELLTTFVRGLGRYQVIGKSDIDSMLGLENMKDQMGCDDATCAAEIGGALGASLLIAGKAARLGDNLILVLKLISANEQKVMNSAKHRVRNDENLYDRAIVDAGRKLFGLPTEQASPAAATSLHEAAQDAPYSQPLSTDLKAARQEGLEYDQWVTLQRFGSAGLDREAFDLFSRSGKPYAVWASDYNDSHESWLVVVVEVVLVGVSGYILGGAIKTGGEVLKYPEFRLAAGIAFPLTAATFVADALSTGDAPTILPAYRR